MMTVHMSANLEMFEQFSAGARVFSKNQIDFFENSNRAKSHIFEVANGRWNYI
jgi:hypothetical protein